MPANPPSPRPELDERLVQVGAEIIQLHSGLALATCRHMVEKNARASLGALGLTAFPGADDPIALKYNLVKDVIARLGNDLIERGVSDVVAAQVRHDLDAFYRGIRGIREGP